MTEISAISPEMLDQLRRGVPLVLARTGRFRFDGADVTHARVESALRAGLDVSEAGEPIVHLGAQWCYLTVEDCPLRVMSVWEDGGALQLRLDDGRALPLPLASLWEEPELGLRVRVPSATSGRPLSARFTNAASMELSAWIQFEGDTPMLEIGGERHPIPDTPSA